MSHAINVGTLKGTNSASPKTVVRFRLVVGMSPNDGRPEYLFARGVRNDSINGVTTVTSGFHRLPSISFAWGYNHRAIGGLWLSNKINKFYWKALG